jgi:hypothetical protein
MSHFACEECRVKKRRCNRKYPCRICLNQAVCWQFRPESDRRRERATFSILFEKVSKYERLFDVLRGGSSGEAIQALYCLRSSHIENQQEPDCSNDMVLDKVLRLADAGFSNSAVCVPRAIAQLSLYWKFPAFCPNMRISGTDPVDLARFSRGSKFDFHVRITRASEQAALNTNINVSDPGLIGNPLVTTRLVLSTSQ